MKPFKRFLPPKVFAAALLGLALSVFFSCENVASIPAPTMTVTASKTLAAPTFPEHTTDDEGNAIAVSYSERYYTVSQGRKRKVYLSWNKVEIAKYYEVYSAEDLNSTFSKVGEPKTNSFEDSVGSGKSYWYKVRAVNYKGEVSEFSSVVRGTSLATPAITDISITDTSATLFWFMGNVGTDTYVKNLVYEITASKGGEEKTATVRAWDDDNQRIVEEYTFENLSGNADYTFQVNAYVTNDTSQVESSPKVSKNTLAQYTPVSPEFTASQGESVDYVNLIITLPSMVQVSIGSGSAAVDYDFPLCFEIQRKKTSESSWTKIVPCLYFNGTTAAPAKEAYDAYMEGAIVEYKDAVANNSASVARGVKYDYRIISCIDTNFALVNGYDFNSLIVSKEAVANTATGWAAAHPAFKVKGYSRKINESDPSKIDSVSLGFDASWNDLDKAQDYKFAITQNRRKFDIDNGNVTDTVGTNSWIQDSMGNILLESIDKVCEITQEYDLSQSPENARGTYRYTLYVIPSKYTTISEGSKYPLDKIEAANVITVDSAANAPSTVLEAEGGWTDHTLLSWVVEDGVSYSVAWKKVNASGLAVDSGTITSSDLLGGGDSYTGTYAHYVEGGYEYQYNLIANGYEGDTVMAKTLGTPSIRFNEHSYTDISVSWPAVVAAKEYRVVLGTNGSFGNGASFMVDGDGSAYNVPDGLTVESALDAPTQTFNLTIRKPYGYNIATLSGKAAPIVITAISELDGNNNVKGQSPASKDVWTIGPASMDLKATETYDVATDSVKITWRALDGAAAYAVYRMRPQMTGSTETNGSVSVKSAALDVYTVNAAGTSISPSTSVAISFADGVYTLTDIYKKAASSESYPMNQQYLALGIPYTYTVLPVLQTEDVDSFISDPSEWRLPSTSDTYSGLASVQKIGYTLGYGIALEATKAEYSDKVLLNWELPQSAIDKNKQPTVYYRKKGSGETWTKAKTLNDPSVHEDVEIIPNSSVAAEAMEYAVTYGDSIKIDADGKDAAYVEYQNVLFNKRITDQEAKCVGYMFTLPKIEPTKQTAADESFTETVQWHFYDFEGNRAVGGSDIASYSLELQNLNCSDAWYPVYTYDANGTKTATGSRDWYDAAFDTHTTGMQVTVTITPNFTPDGIYNTTTFHDGLLKVQRDYKHYYRISATRQNSQGETITAQSVDYAYRKITDDERDKAVGLICADAFFQMGMPALEGLGMWKWSEPRELSGVKGTMIIQHQSTSDNCRWGTSSGEYQHKFPRTPGNQNTDDDKNAYLASGFTIIIPNTEGGALGGASGSKWTHNLQKLPKTTIAISHETGLSSYTGSRIVENVPSDFPYDFGNKHESGDSTLNTGFQTYNGLWWEVR